MEIYYFITFFIFRTIFGSFYNVVGYRLPKGESLIHPPSHCPKCNHLLKYYELIPIISFLLQGGKCRECKKKIPWFYPIFETCCGILFALAYLSFGFNYELVIALIFISMNIIVVLSDYRYMIIPDEVLIFFGIIILICIYSFFGFTKAYMSVLSGIYAFGIMFLIKLFGDFLFKKESMGGGDIKLMFIFGLVLGWKEAILSIFIGSFIGLPISLYILNKKKSHIIPFGPFLSSGALIILLTQINFEWVINILTKI